MKNRMLLPAALLASLGSPLAAGPPERPNILICVADDASYPHMGAYGCPWVKTPAFDRVADQGILFNRAYTPNAKCAPSRACLLTGRNSWQLEEAANHFCYFPAKFKTYPEALGEKGYHVGYTGKGWAPGDAGGRQLAGPAFAARKAPPPTPRISGNNYAANFADFLEAKPADQPFCFWYGGLEPHRPYTYASGLEKGGKETNEVERVFAFWRDNETVRTDMLDYAFEIEHFDRHLGRMLDELEKRGLLDNTLVVVTSDNGMPFPRVKGQAYELSNHMPLAVMWKKGIAQPGRKVDDFVSFIDLAPTFLELAGLTAEEAGMQPVTGSSLGKILRSKQAGMVEDARDHVLIGKERHDVGRPNDEGYPIRGIFKGGYLFVQNFEPDRWPAGNPETGYLNTDGSPTKTDVLCTRHTPEAHIWEACFGKRPGEELYELGTDPDCVDNLASRPEYRERKRALRDQLFEELKEQDDPRMFGKGAQFDRYPYAGKDRNYYERFKKGEVGPGSWVNASDYHARPFDEDAVSKP